jgi:hypothetical protein
MGQSSREWRKPEVSVDGDVCAYQRLTLNHASNCALFRRAKKETLPGTRRTLYYLSIRLELRQLREMSPELGYYMKAFFNSFILRSYLKPQTELSFPSENLTVSLCFCFFNLGH